MFNKAGCQRSLFSNKSVSGGPGASHKGLLFKATKWEFPNKIKFLKKPHRGTVKGKLAGSNEKYLTHRPLWKHGKVKYSTGWGTLGCIQGQGVEAPMCSPGTHLHELGETTAHSTVTYWGEGLQSRFSAVLNKGGGSPCTATEAIFLVPTPGTWKSHYRAHLAPLLHSAFQSKAKPVSYWEALR